MLSVIATVCHLYIATTCKEITLNYMHDTQYVTPFTCMQVGQTELAKWSYENPNWSIKKFTCKTSKELEAFL